MYCFDSKEASPEVELEDQIEIDEEEAEEEDDEIEIEIEEEEEEEEIEDRGNRKELPQTGTLTLGRLLLLLNWSEETT